MAGNQVVARYRDGRVVKGVTNDFLPARELFHVIPAGEQGTPAAPVSVRFSELKALFFVRDLGGDAGHRTVNDFEQGRAAPGRRIRVVFEDGEVMAGTTQGYSSGRVGFFVIPVDDEGNNERVFVVAAATREVELL